MIGDSTSGWMRDINVCEAHLGKVKFLAFRGQLADAQALLAIVQADLATLKSDLDAAVISGLAKDLAIEPVLDDPILNPLP